MKFPSATWRFRDSTREHDGYLFVDANSGIIVPVVYTLANKVYRYMGFGLWFHDFADFEIVTTHIKRSGQNTWLHEYYRIDDNWMQWSNKNANIFHELVFERDVPEGYRYECQRIKERSADLVKPDYDPTSLRPSCTKQECEQDAPSNGGQRPSLNSGFHSRRG